MAASAIDGIHQAEAALGSSAARMVGHVLNPNSDTVTLSDVAIALIQARIGLEANISVARAAMEVEKALIDVAG